MRKKVRISSSPILLEERKRQIFKEKSLAFNLLSGRIMQHITCQHPCAYAFLSLTSLFFTMRHQRPPLGGHPNLVFPSVLRAEVARNDPVTLPVCALSVFLHAPCISSSASRQNVTAPMVRFLNLTISRRPAPKHPPISCIMGSRPGDHNFLPG